MILFTLYHLLLPDRPLLHMNFHLPHLLLYPPLLLTHTFHLLMRLNFLLSGTQPVSYTHLDVYKRQDLDIKGKNKSYYPLTKLSMTITNFDIIDLQKTVVDMFGNQVHTFKSSAGKEDEEKTTSSKADEKTPKLECCKYQVTFTDQKALQELSLIHI